MISRSVCNNVSGAYKCFCFSFSIEPKQSNFPKSLEKVFIGQAVDMARQCVQAPIRKNPK